MRSRRLRFMVFGNNAAAGSGSSGGGIGAPTLDFSDPNNSMYIGAIT